MNKRLIEEDRKMNNKAVALVPVTRRAKRAIEHRGHIEIDEFPFRVGRESRIGCRWGRFTGLECRHEDSLPNNDLYLLSKGKNAKYVSREHFQIEKREDGIFELVDRGSTLGTTVEGKHLTGNHAEQRAALQNGTPIAIGPADSPLVFKFISEIAPLRVSLRRRTLANQCLRVLLFGIAPFAVSAMAILSVL